MFGCCKVQCIMTLLVFGMKAQTYEKPQKQLAFKQNQANSLSVIKLQSVEANH